MKNVIKKGLSGEMRPDCKFEACPRLNKSSSLKIYYLAMLISV